MRLRRAGLDRTDVRRLRQQPSKMRLYNQSEQKAAIAASFQNARGYDGCRMNMRQEERSL